jgi:hypothetical protein
MKRFKEYILESIDIDPYGEENWNTEYDLSEMEIDEKIEKLKELILNKVIKFNFILFISSSMYVSYKYKKVIGETVNNIYLDEDGYIVMGNDRDDYYTLDTRYPIIIGDNEITIKL